MVRRKLPPPRCHRIQLPELPKDAASPGRAEEHPNATLNGDADGTHWRGIEDVWTRLWEWRRGEARLLELALIDRGLARRLRECVILWVVKCAASCTQAAQDLVGRTLSMNSGGEVVNVSVPVHIVQSRHQDVL